MPNIGTDTSWLGDNHIPENGSLRNRVGRHLARQPVPVPAGIPYSLSDGIARTREVHASLSSELRAVEQRIRTRRVATLTRAAGLNIAAMEAQHDDRSLARQLNTQRARIAASLSGRAARPIAEPSPHQPLEVVRLGSATTLAIAPPAQREQGTQWSFSAPDI